MAEPLQIITTVGLVATSGYLVWIILRIRQRRLRLSKDPIFFLGEAKNPETLANLDSEAIDEMDKLLLQAGFNIPDEE
jgi:hypothetical protein